MFKSRGKSNHDMLKLGSTHVKFLLHHVKPPAKG